MASDKQAQLVANLVRERYMRARVAEITGLPDYDTEFDAALGARPRGGERSDHSATG